MILSSKSGSPVCALGRIASSKIHRCAKWWALFLLLVTAASSRAAAAQGDTPVQTELARLVAPPPRLDVNRQFNWFVGYSVAISGEWVAVSDFVAGRTGEVYVYRRTPQGWIFHQRLWKPLSETFGHSVAIDGDTLVVGDIIWGWPRLGPGKVFVYQLQGEEWVEVQQLFHPELMGEWPALFGFSVAVDGDVLVVGAPGVSQPVFHAGAVFVYERVGGLWEEAARFKLRPTQDVIDREYGQLGFRVAVSGSRAVAGASWGAGAALVYERTSQGWQHGALLRNPSSPEWGRFGEDVDIDGDLVLVGMPLGTNFTPKPGRALLYRRQVDGSWDRIQAFRASDGYANADHGDDFGFSVAVDGDLCVVGAQAGRLNGQNTGTIYEFKRGVGGWSSIEDKRWIASEPHGQSDLLGGALDLEGEWVISGAVGGWVDGIREGKAYLFAREPGESSCHSTGSQSRLALTGSIIAQDERISLVLRDAPANSPSVLFLSPKRGHRPFGSQMLCLGQPVIPLFVGKTGPDGGAVHPLDFSDPRFAGRLVSGLTLGFQLATKDSSSTSQNGSGVKTTNSVFVTLE